MLVKKKKYSNLHDLFRSVFVCFIISILLITCACDDKISLPKHRLQWWLESISWDSNRLTYTGEGITIAIIDSGVDNEHVDLHNSIKKNFRVSQLNSDISDNDLTHGTAVAGIICGYPNDEKGVLGIAPGVELISIDITDNDHITSESLAEGIRIAMEENVDIINISAGIEEDNVNVYNAIRDAYERGIIIIASAGNFMESNILYPAYYKEVIPVGALNKKGAIISPKSYSERNVIYLPGENIVSTYPNDAYGALSGTSAATPILSGIIALMLEANKKVSQTDIYDYFENCNGKMIKVQNCIKMK